MEAPIPISNQQASALSELAGAAQEAFNVVVDASQAVRMRPGIQAASSVYADEIDANGLDAVFLTQTGDLYTVGSAPGVHKLYRVTSAGMVQLSDSADSTTYLYGAERPHVAETEALLVLAGGGKVSKITLASKTAGALGGTPPEATHVIANNSRLLANDISSDNRGRIWFSSQAAGSSVTGHEQWLTDGVIDGTEGFFSAEGRPDPILALHENTNEVYAFGATSLQVFVPDAIGIYAPASQREFGCGAAYSVVKLDHSFAWLDQRRRFVVSDGRSSEVVSDPIQQVLNDMTTVSDCWGFRVVTGPLDAVVWVFPTDGRTFCFQKGSGWSQWSSAGDAAFIGNCHFQRWDNSENLIGTTTGKIGALKMGVQSDLGDNFKARVRTGYLNRSTDQVKHCEAVRVSLRRGTTSSSSAPVAWLKWRDRPGVWTGKIPISLGATGQTEIVRHFHSLGVYRRRQWEFEFSGTEDLELAGVTEQFSISGD